MLKSYDTHIMPDLTLQADTKQYQDLAGEFAANEIAARAGEFDKSRQFPLTLAGKAFEVGLVNVRLPEQLGGLGLSLFDACVIAEELGKACAGIAAVFWGNDLGVAPLLVAGSEQQQQQWLKPFAEKFGVAAACFEPPHISYVHSNDRYVLNGKALVVNYTHGVFFCAPAQAQQSGAQTAFIVPLAAAGVERGDRLNSIGLKAADIGWITLKDVSLTGDHVIDTEYGAESVFGAAAAVALPIVASYAAGIGAAALKHSLRYAQERQTMGTAIVNHQAVAFLLADMARHLEACRFMIRKAAWLADHQQADPAYALMTRNYCLDATMQTTIDAVQVFGGYGYSKEYPVEKLMRDAKMLQLCKPPLAGDHLTVAKKMLSAV